MTITSVPSTFAANASLAGTAGLSSARALNETQRATIRAVNAINTSAALGSDNELTYSVDRAAHVVVVKLIDKQTGSVVQQIPAEYVLKMAEELNGESE
jgi:uncharacterized FlaG/YvyC family protein